MTKTTLIPAALAAFLLAPAAFAATPPPAPKIVVFDERALMQFSKAGQDIQRQVRAYAQQVQNEKAATEKSLQGEREAMEKSLQGEQAQLQQQVAILAPDVRQKKIQAFQTKAQNAQVGLQRKAQNAQTALASKAQQIDAGVQQAQGEMSKALAPILQQVMKERGANLVILKQAVLMADTNNFDITGDVITRLNVKLSAVKVSLVNRPAQK